MVTYIPVIPRDPVTYIPVIPVTCDLDSGYPLTQWPT